MTSRKPKPRTVVEVGLYVTDKQLARLQGFFKALKIPFYVEPDRDPPYKTIEELKADCE